MLLQLPTQFTQPDPYSEQKTGVSLEKVSRISMPNHVKKKQEDSVASNEGKNHEAASLWQHEKMAPVNPKCRFTEVASLYFSEGVLVLVHSLFQISLHFAKLLHSSYDWLIRLHREAGKGCGSVAEHFLRMQQAPGSIPGRICR